MMINGDNDGTKAHLSSLLICTCLYKILLTLLIYPEGDIFEYKNIMSFIFYIDRKEISLFPFKVG